LAPPRQPQAQDVSKTSPQKYNTDTEKLDYHKALNRAEVAESRTSELMAEGGLDAAVLPQAAQGEYATT
jgi:hypothetical protein